MLATTDELARQMGTSFDDAEEVTRAEQLIELASGIVESYCGRRFTRTTDDVVNADPTGRTLLLANPPIDVTSITLDGETVDDYIVYADSGVVILPTDHTYWDRVEVTYTHGTETVPAAIKTIVLLIAARMWHNTDGATQKSIGDASISYGASGGPGLSDLEQQVLDGYRITGVS